MKIVGSARCGATEDGLAHPAMACRVIFYLLKCLLMAIIKEISDMTNTAKAIIKEMASYTVISYHLLS